ncbi:hypothetical protein C8R45DRAFT_1114043 [Mycena sanguinolenta]|nr:hypothetical protein C8R45DRAFT_1114043 [Mycena sanguinolenta]
MIAVAMARCVGRFLGEWCGDEDRADAAAGFLCAWLRPSAHGEPFACDSSGFGRVVERMWTAQEDLDESKCTPHLPSSIFLSYLLNVEERDDTAISLRSHCISPSPATPSLDQRSVTVISLVWSPWGAGLTVRSLYHRTRLSTSTAAGITPPRARARGQDGADAAVYVQRSINITLRSTCSCRSTRKDGDGDGTSQAKLLYLPSYSRNSPNTGCSTPIFLAFPFFSIAGTSLAALSSLSRPVRKQRFRCSQHHRSFPTPANAASVDMHLMSMATKTRGSIRVTPAHEQEHGQERGNLPRARGVVEDGGGGIRDTVTHQRYSIVSKVRLTSRTSDD